jgi:hypothetical protein
MKKYHFLNPKGVTAHNLLINGDFQVNQRGQSSYTCDGTKRVGGVDMWSFSKADTFMKVTENGIETNAPISQMFNKLKSGVKYTVVCSIDNVIHTKSITGGTYDTGTSQTIMYLAFNDVERIVITPNGTQTINYVDLFEGEIVYKHQKEDHAIALTRCLPYVEMKNVNTVGMYNSPTNAIYYVDYYKKKEIPTIQILSAGSVNGDETLPNRETTNANTYGTINENNCGIESQFETVSGATGKCCKIQYVKILITCEPL